MGEKECHLIHSDQNDNSGVGKISLRSGLEKLQLDPDYNYKIGLIGGASEGSVKTKKAVLQKFLPNATFEYEALGGQNAYVHSSGKMSVSKAELIEQLDCSSIKLNDVDSEPKKNSFPQM